MSFSHGVDADFDVATTSIQAYLESIDPTFDRPASEIKALGSSWVQQVVGLRSLKISLKGVFDPTLDTALWTAFDAATATAGVYYPQGNSAGMVKYSGNFRVVTYKPGPAADGKLEASAELVGDGTWQQGTVSA